MTTARRSVHHFGPASPETLGHNTKPAPFPTVTTPQYRSSSPGRKKKNLRGMTSVLNPTSTLSSSSSASSRVRLPMGRQRVASGGRQRKIPAMNGSERSKYYRQLRAKATADLQAATLRLYDEIAWAKLALELHRRLTPTIEPGVRTRAMESLRKYVNEHIMNSTFGLVDVRRTLSGFEVLYDGPPSPILRLRYSIKGRLHALAVEKLYPFVVGNTMALTRMLQEDLELDCHFTVFYDAVGRIENVEVDRGDVLAHSRPLFSLVTAARALHGFSLS